ncbi:HAD-IA family hydrolase [Uliginosibacterium sp. H3]|uniref:HAD-IA family hydrolase n=1 Tax=Uliginosibacterium silvisoli TaxID=3114758 RepID=A0ABU6K4F5_9RHOO|nr:HAD-IA family hydrolase [Uliginosibacterium sp. H3]
MTNRAFDLIVFDWDGTLIDSTALIAGSVQLAAADVGLPVPSDEDAKHIIGLGLLQAMTWLFPGLNPEQYQALIERYRLHYLKRDSEIALFSNVRELLIGLRKDGYLLAVATGKARQALDRALLQADLAKYFDSTRCADETFSKPHPQMLLELIDELMVEPARVLMVGDTTHDLQMAANAGTAALAVTCGAHPNEVLRSEPHLAMLPDVSGLREWLRGGQ